MPRTLAALVAVLTLAAAPAFAGIADSPLPVLTAGATTFHLYSVPGVVSHSPSSLGLASFFSCTSTDTTPMQVAVEFFEKDGTLDCMGSLTANPGATVTFGTRPAAGIPVDSYACGGPYGTGSARILATSKKLTCTAYVADWTNAPPQTSWQLTIIAKTKQKAAN